MNIPANLQDVQHYGYSAQYDAEKRQLCLAVPVDRVLEAVSWLEVTKEVSISFVRAGKKEEHTFESLGAVYNPFKKLMELAISAASEHDVTDLRIEQKTTSGVSVHLVLTHIGNDLKNQYRLLLEKRIS